MRPRRSSSSTPVWSGSSLDLVTSDRAEPDGQDTGVRGYSSLRSFQRRLAHPLPSLLLLAVTLRRAVLLPRQRRVDLQQHTTREQPTEEEHRHHRRQTDEQEEPPARRLHDVADELKEEPGDQDKEAGLRVRQLLQRLLRRPARREEQPPLPAGLDQDREDE